jgi:4-hydroxythreonine-4-phosphate dehydrogenase
MNRLLKVSLSQGSGDKNSYDLLARLLAVPELLEICTPLLFGSAEATTQAVKEAALDPVKWNVVGKPQDIAEGKANIYERFEGWADEAATRACTEGVTQVLITLTEPSFTTPAPEAITALRVQQCSYFCPELTDETTSSLLESTRRIHTAMRTDFTHLRPRIALVMPTHSTLETTVLHDVCRTLHDEGILLFGPFDEEVFLAQGMAAHYDAVIVPGDAEALHRLTAEASPTESFSYTTGLRYLQASPFAANRLDDALDSLRLALYSAIDICRNRRRYTIASHNPLQKQWNPRGKDDFKLDLTKDVDAD